MEALRQSAGNMDSYQVWLDAACLDYQPLFLRARRPGDVIHPLGLGGHSQKISDAMINAHIPSRARRGWPIVSAGERVVWLPGIALSHFARLTETSTRAVHLKLHRSK
jgi:tRNA(Ile)-lysidine synthase